GTKRAVRAGVVVFVIGSGPIGALMVRAAFLHRARQVIVTDTNPERLAFALAQGAEGVPADDALEAVTAATDGWGADVVIDAAGFETTWALGLQAVRGRTHLRDRARGAPGDGRLLHRAGEGGDDHRVVRVERPGLRPIARAPRRRRAHPGWMAHARPARRRARGVRGSGRSRAAIQGAPRGRMKLLSYDGGFGRVEDGAVVPMGIDLVRFLATGTVQTGAPIPLTSVRPRAPVPRPGKVICVGLNYRDHAE